MSESTVKTLVGNLSFSQNDATQTDEYYVDAVRDLTQRDFLTEATLLAATGGTASYTITDSITRILDMFHDTTVLSRETVSNMQGWKTNWRDAKGSPAFYVFEQEASKQFRLVPTPDISSQDFSFALGAPFGTDFPEDSVLLVHSETPDNVQDWLDLPLALDVTAKEFSRESSHRDVEFAQACREMANLIYEVI